MNEWLNDWDMVKLFRMICCTCFSLCLIHSLPPSITRSPFLFLFLLVSQSLSGSHVHFAITRIIDRHLLSGFNWFFLFRTYSVTSVMSFSGIPWFMCHVFLCCFLFNWFFFPDLTNMGTNVLVFSAREEVPEHQIATQTRIVEVLKWGSEHRRTINKKKKIKNYITKK